MTTKTASLALGALLLAGCTGLPTGPAADAGQGKPAAMMALVRSGQHGVNERMEMGGMYPTAVLPLCQVMGPEAAQFAAAHELLDRGAKADLPCEAGGNEYPLDRVFFSYGIFADPARNTYNPPIMGEYDRLVARVVSLGARSARGRFASMADVQPHLVGSIANIRKVDADYARYLEAEEEKKRLERQRARESDNGTLMGLVTIASMATNNYQAAKSASRQAAIPLPIADVPKITATPAAPKPVPSAAPSRTPQPAPAQAQATSRAPVPASIAANALVAAVPQGSATSGFSSAPAAARSAAPSQVAAVSPATEASRKPERKPEWGAIKLEATAICIESKRKRGIWVCHGPLDNDVLFEDSLEVSLKRQRCEDAERMPMGTTYKGERWETFRCGRSLGSGDEDIGKRHGLAAIQRRYICPKTEPVNGICKTLYDGQDRR